MIFQIIDKIRGIQNVLVSLIYKFGLKKCGNNFRIEYPMRIIGGKYITIGKNFSAFGRLRLEAFDFHNGVKYNPAIQIGDNVSINFDCHIGAMNKIVIGNDVLIASRVFITDHFHGHIDKKNLLIPTSKRFLYSKGPVIIGDNVWVGEGAVIMPNVSIGKNSIIGANAVVTKSCPENSIIGGVPARLIKTIDK